MVQDAWEWASTEIAAPVISVKEDLKEEKKVMSKRELCSKRDVSSLLPHIQAPETVESVLQKDGRGHVVWNLVETERNYVTQLGILQNVHYKFEANDGGGFSMTGFNHRFSGNEWRSRGYCPKPL